MIMTVAYPKKGWPWTDQDDRDLRLWYETKSIREISDSLGRTPHSIYARVRALGLGNSR